jgi:hypothetical protein
MTKSKSRFFYNPMIQEAANAIFETFEFLPHNVLAFIRSAEHGV